MTGSAENEPRRFEASVRASMRADRFGPAPDRIVRSVMSEVERGPRRRGGGWRLWPVPVLPAMIRFVGQASVIAVGVAAGLLLAAFMSVRGPEVGLQPPSPVSPSGPRATASASASEGDPDALPGFVTDVRAMAVADDGLWVASGYPGIVQKLDTTTRRPVLSVRVAGTPNFLAVASGSVWVAHERTGGLDRINADTGAILGRLDTGPGALAVGAGSLWFAGHDELMQIDLATGAVIETTPVDHPADHGIAADDNGVWLAAPTGITRVDPRSNEVSAVVDEHAWKVAIGGGAVWAIHGTEILRIDPTTNEVVARIGGLPLTEDIAWGGGALWAVGPQSSDESALLAQIDPSINQVVARTPLGNGAQAVVVDGTSVWAATLDDPVIWRFDLPGE